MSNVGQIALTVVGTVIGAYFGNPELGLTLGALAGSALFPTQLPDGPRITDNRTTTASIGVPVPIGFGTFDVAGTVVWLAPYIEHSNEQGGKGGPEQKLYSYTQSIAIGLCERTDDDAADNVGAIAGISRIWENGQLVYDIRPQLQQNTLIGQAAETDENYAARLSISAAYADTFTLYLGDNLQEADPTIEAIEGAGNAPGFRGLAYIVFPNRLLTYAQGLRHPNFTFECYTSGLGNCQANNELSADILYPWRTNDGTENPLNALNNHTFVVEEFDANKTIAPAYGSVFTSLDACLSSATGTGGYSQLVFLQYDVDESEPPFLGGLNIGEFNSGTGRTADPIALSFQYNIAKPSSDRFYTGAQRIAGPGTYEIIPNILLHWATSTGSYTGQLVKNLSPQLNTIGTDTPTDRDYGSKGGISADGNPPFIEVDILYDVKVRATRVLGKPLNPCTGLEPSIQFPDYAIDPTTGNLIKCGEWTDAPAIPGGGYKVLAALRVNGNDVDQYPIGPCVASTDPNYDSESFWLAAYDAAVTKGDMPAGKVYGTDYPVAPTHAYSIDQQICTGSGNAVALSAIITAICKRAGLSSMQIDTSDLTAVTVHGYTISTISDGANAIAPLRSVGFFDCVESANQAGGVLRFPTRGKAIVATFTEDDFGCYDNSGNATTPGPAITTTRADETTLPRQIRLHYKSVERDYQDGEQDSPFRLTTAAVNDQDVSLAICLNDAQAVQDAEIIWSDAWAAQNAYTLTVDQSKFAIEVGDAIAVPIDGVLERLRITSDTLSSFVLRQLNCVRDDDAAYVSTAEPPATGYTSAPIIILGATATEYLDLPALQDADADAGFYAAAQRAGGNGTWRGAILYSSPDGTTFTSLTAFSTEAVCGTLAAAVAASPCFTWDDATVITVTLPANFTFESRTDAAVIAGANTAAMGADGRWEIVQFANAAKISATQWQLSRLLRGRRGTEHVVGSSQTGDAFVLVSTGDLKRIAVNAAQLGVASVYDNVTIGASFSTGIKTTFAGHGEALKPFSPVHLHAVVETSGDILITWTRRDRLGRTLMSGSDIPMSEASESYEIDILDHLASPHTVKRTLTSGTPAVTYTTVEQSADFPSGISALSFAVYQISAVVGRGTPGAATIEFGSDVVTPPVDTHTAVVTFGGTFDASAGIYVQINFSPLSGATQSYNVHLSGSGHSSLPDLAADFATAASAAIGSHGTCSASGVVATLSSSTGEFSVQVQPDWLQCNVVEYQAQGPTSAGSGQIAWCDLYTGTGAISPSNDAAYGNPGTVNYPFVVHAYDEVEETRITRLQQPAIPAGLEEGDRATQGFPVTVSFSGSGVGSTPAQQLYGLAAALNANTNLRPYLVNAGNGQYSSGVVNPMIRSAVTIAMKTGYRIVFGGSGVGQSTPSGYVLQTREANPGAAAYTGTGRQAITAVQFNYPYDPALSAYAGALESGQVINLVVDGTTYSHTVDSTDLADAAYFDAIYADFKTQLEATGNYTVQESKLYRTSGSTATFIYQIVITRVTGNTAMSVSASSPFPINVTVTYT